MKMRNTAILMLSALLALGGLSGCETMRNNKTATGAVIGTAAGAGIGALAGGSDNRTEGALIGAAAGAAVGGGIGYYLARQAKKYDEIPAVEVTEVPEDTSGQQSEHLVLRLSDTVLFDKGSATLSAAGMQKVAEIAQVMNEYPETEVYVKAYASSDGSEQYNQELTDRRAETVRRALVANRVSQGRIVAVGMGESNPIASNATEAGRAQNRRVEIELYPMNGA